MTSADSTASSPDSDRCPTNLSPQTGHFETEGEIDQAIGLTQIQFRAIELNLQGFEDTQIADLLSINRKTLWRWKTLNEDYRRLLAEARMQLRATITDRVTDIAIKATDVLAELLNSSVDKHRLRAAQILLNHAARLRLQARDNHPVIPE